MQKPLCSEGLISLRPSVCMRETVREHLNGLYINYQLYARLLFIHKILFSSTCFEPQVLIFRRHSCIHAAYGTITLYESSWWPVGTQLEWELQSSETVREHLNGLYINYQLDARLLSINKILFSSTCFEPQVLIFRRTQLYTCSI